MGLDTGHLWRRRRPTEEGEEPVRRGKKLDKTKAARWQDHGTQESSSPGLGTISLYEPQSSWPETQSQGAQSEGQPHPSEHLTSTSLQEQGEAVCLLFMGGGWERQPTEFQPPGADLLVFQSGTPQTLHTPSSLPPTVSASTDIQEMEEKLWAMVQLSTPVVLGARQRQIPALPQPCVLIPQAPGPTIGDCAPTLYFLDVSRCWENYWVTQLQTFKYWGLERWLSV